MPKKKPVGKATVRESDVESSPSDTFAADYAATLPRLKSVAVPEGYQFGFDVDAALKNAEVTAKYLEGVGDARIRELLPKIAAAGRYKHVYALASTLHHASDLLAATEPDAPTLQLKIREGYALRAKLGSAHAALAAAGYVSAVRHAELAAGKGDRDMAGDLVGYVGSFRKHAVKIKGKHPLSRADIDAAEQLGAWLLKRVKATRASKKATIAPEALALRAIRNQAAIALREAYTDAEKIGYVELHDAYRTQIPALNSREARAKPSKPKGAPPAAAPAKDAAKGG